MVRLIAVTVALLVLTACVPEYRTVVDEYGIERRVMVGWEGQEYVCGFFLLIGAAHFLCWLFQGRRRSVTHPVEEDDDRWLKEVSYFDEAMKANCTCRTYDRGVDIVLPPFAKNVRVRYNPNRTDR